MGNGSQQLRAVVKTNLDNAPIRIARGDAQGDRNRRIQNGSVRRTNPLNSGGLVRRQNGEGKRRGGCRLSPLIDRHRGERIAPDGQIRTSNCERLVGHHAETDGCVPKFHSADRAGA